MFRRADSCVEIISSIDGPCNALWEPDQVMEVFMSEKIKNFAKLEDYMQRLDNKINEDDQEVIKKHIEEVHYDE